MKWKFILRVAFVSSESVEWLFSKNHAPEKIYNAGFWLEASAA